MALRSAAFYAVANAAHFIGLVALVNSLLLAGHDEPLLIADSGLEDWQRQLLRPHAEVIAIDGAAPPHLLKVVLPLEHGARVMAHLDADLIVLRPLTPLLEIAEAGRVVAFTDPVSRFDSRWETLLELPPVRRQPYLNSGMVVLPAQPGRRVLEAMADNQGRVDFHRSHWQAGRPSDPFYYADQDLFNAVLASLVEPDELEILEARLAPHPPFAGLSPVEGGAPRFAYDDGSQPYVLHHIGPKPWLHSTRRNLYSELLPRLLLADELPLRLDSSRVPRRFRRGALARVEGFRVETAARLHAQRGKLGLRRRLAERQAARGA